MTSAANAARAGALVVEQPKRGTLSITGPDRCTWLNGVISAEVASLGAGDGRWGLALNKQGKIQSDLTIVSGADTLYVSVAPERFQQLAEQLDSMLIMEDAELRECSQDFEWIEVHGPNAAAIGKAVSSSHRAVAGDVDWTGLGGVALVAPRTTGDAIIRELVEDGAFRASPADWLQLRIERIVPEWSTDFGENDNPHEAHLDKRAVSWTKGCYLGQEVVCMQDMRGKVRRRVELLEIEGAGAIPAGTPVHALAPKGEAAAAGEAEPKREPEEVGRVTSASFSDLAGSTVALAMLRTKYREGELRVGTRRAHFRAEPV
jgi:tRNA-modifying protein YgfZ